MAIKGRARFGRITKHLVRRLTPHDVAIIDHRDLDEVAAVSLIKARVKAVVNLQDSLTGAYPNRGPLRLAEANLPLLDKVGEDLLRQLNNGDVLELRGEEIWVGERTIARGRLMTREVVTELLKQAEENFHYHFLLFIKNTLEHAQQEAELFSRNLDLPSIQTDMNGKHVLLVVRGHSYREDLRAIRSYVAEVRPVMIGVDGGADALMEYGYRPAVVLGDMDSVSDQALRSGAELVIHAYPDGHAPGRQRLEQLGLQGKVFPCPGTSEDAAMLLASQMGADLIVAVGAHSNTMEFMEKGRRGMGSTLLVRLKIGPILVDAKGLNKLYPRRWRSRYLAGIVTAALLPLTLLIVLSPTTSQLVRLLIIRFRLLLNL